MRDWSLMARRVLHNFSWDLHAYMHVSMYGCTSTASYQPLIHRLALVEHLEVTRMK